MAKNFEQTMKDIMPIVTAKRFEVGNVVENLDVIITTAGKTEQVDKSKPIKQSKQGWTQKLGVTDTTGHMWAIVPTDVYNPLVKGRGLIIREARIDEIINKGGGQERVLNVTSYEVPTMTADEAEAKPKFEGVVDPMIEKILLRYDISATDALWPLKRTDKQSGIVRTMWIIFHRYCEQIAAKANIVLDDPKVIANEKDDKGIRTVVILVKGRLGWNEEWSFGEATFKAVMPYVFAMAEKRAKDRVILKLAGFHGMVYSDAEEDWSNDK